MNKIPHRNDLMKPTIEAIQALGGSGSIDEIVEKVISLLGIPDELVERVEIDEEWFKSI
jgi:restriction system protein